MAQIVYCTTASTVEEAARLATNELAAKGWTAPADPAAVLPSGAASGSVCPDDLSRFHWLLEMPDEVDVSAAVLQAQTDGVSLAEVLDPSIDEVLAAAPPVRSNVP